MPASLLTPTRITELLTLRAENKGQDYRRNILPKSHKACAFLDLIKDLAAMANTGGGVIVFGVEDEGYQLVGIETKGKCLDEQDVAQGFRTYLSSTPPFELVFHKRDAKDFAFLAVGAVDHTVYFTKPANCPICKDKSSAKHFFVGATYIRDGSSTVRASDDWIVNRRKQVQGASGDAKVGVTLHNLPASHAIYDIFVGRQESYDRTITLLSDERRRVTWIQGSGGIGKTALAYRVADKLVSSPDVIGPIDYLVWVSAKETVLTTSGIEAIEPQFATVRDIVRTIAATTGVITIGENDLNRIETAEEAIAVIEPILKDNVGLLILDNLETVRDREVLLFLENLPGKTRSLVTTRHSMDPTRAATVELHPMSVSDATELVEAEAMRTGNGWLATDQKSLLEVLNLSARIPLAIRLIVPVLTSKKALTKYGSASQSQQSNLFGFCYSRTFEILNPFEQRVFFSIASFEEGLSFADLAYILGIDLHDYGQSNKLSTGVEKLWHVSFVAIRQAGAGLRYEIHSLLRQYAARLLARNALMKQELREKIELLHKAKECDFGARVERAIALARTTGDYEAARAAIGECLEHDRQNAAALLARAEIEMHDGKDLRAALRFAKDAQEHAKPGSNRWVRAAVVIADVELGRSHVDVALDTLLEAQQVNPCADILVRLGEIYLRFGARKRRGSKEGLADFREAVEYARRSLKAMREGQSFSDLKARAFSLWAEAALDLDPGVCYQAAERALRLDSPNGDKLKGLQEKALVELEGAPVSDLLQEE